jgi:hypothetical protein
MGDGDKWERGLSINAKRPGEEFRIARRNRYVLHAGGGGMANEDFERYLNEEKALDTKRQELIRSLLKQRESFLQEIDAKLARLGHKTDRPKRGRPKGTVLKPAA